MSVPFLDNQFFIPSKQEKCTAKNIQWQEQSAVRSWTIRGIDLGGKQDGERAQVPIRNQRLQIHLIERQVRHRGRSQPLLFGPQKQVCPHSQAPSVPGVGAIDFDPRQVRDSLRLVLKAQVFPEKHLEYIALFD